MDFPLQGIFLYDGSPALMPSQLSSIPGVGGGGEQRSAARSGATSMSSGGARQMLFLFPRYGNCLLSYRYPFGWKHQELPGLAPYDSANISLTAILTLDG